MDTNAFEPSPRRVVVTGMGIISPCGIGKEALSRAITDGRSANKIKPEGDPEPLPVPIAPVNDFHAGDFFSPAIARRLDRASQMAVAAALLAVRDANLNPQSVHAIRAGVVDGTSLGALGNILSHYADYLQGTLPYISPNFLISFMTGSSSSFISQLMGWHACATTFCEGSVSSSVAIGEGYERIKNGQLDIVLCGGCESPLMKEIILLFFQAKLLSRQIEFPEKACRPFNQEREGFVLGEGAVYFVLESLSSALRRKAPVYGEICGFSMNTDAYHPTSPHPEGKMLGWCIRDCLQKAGVQPEAIDYINAHGTATLRNDIAESRAICSVFGSPEQQPLVSSTKPITGHLLGACGALEIAICLLALQAGFIPPSLNAFPRDPRCPVRIASETDGNISPKVALSINSSFGGRNTAIVVRKFTR